MSQTFKPEEVDPTDNWPNPKDIGLPEAPLSIHIDAYYKGFHSGITIRMMDNTSIPADRIKRAIDSLIAGGFEPSWNKETSKGFLNQTVTPRATTIPQNGPSAMCPIHNELLVLRPAGVSKSTGRAYPAFYACPGNNEMGEFCNYRPKKL